MKMYKEMVVSLCSGILLPNKNKCADEIASMYTIFLGNDGAQVKHNLTTNKLEFHECKIMCKCFDEIFGARIYNLWTKNKINK